MELKEGTSVDCIDAVTRTGRNPYRTWFYGDVKVAIYTNVEDPYLIDEVALLDLSKLPNLTWRIYSVDWRKNPYCEAAETLCIEREIHKQLMREFAAAN